jgi:regulator of protease activity HflC (stomatin/prohibitin superfamily)
MKENQISPVNVSKKVLMGIVAIVSLFVLSFVLSGVMEDCDKSKNYVCQFPVTGKYEVWTEGGAQFQWWGNVYEYNKTTQVEFTGVEKNEEGYIASGNNPGAAVTFNDRGRGFIIGSLRVILPRDFAHMAKIQQEFGSEDALITTLIKPTLYKVVTSCGPLMSSLESVSETRTDLIQYITDQLNNGVYKTRVEKIKAVNELTGDTETISKAEILVDRNGNYMRQEGTGRIIKTKDGKAEVDLCPFQQYGITCNLVSITDIKYDKATQDQIDAQKQANLAVVTAKTKSLEAIQKTVLITEQGKADAEKAKWEQEKIKAVEVTKAQQEFEVAKLEAAKAEEVARKVRAEGEAKAAANRALVSAGATPEQLLQMKKETMIGIAHELANSNTEWVPKIMVNGGNGNGSDPMQTVGLNMLMQTIEKMNNIKW